MSCFTDVEEEQLIEHVEENPIIYDLSHEHYRNSVMKDRVWKVIGRDMDKNGEDCKKKWKAIRDGYHRFKKKQKAGVCPWFAGPKNTKDRRHMLLTFLDDIVPPKPGGSQLKEESQDISDQEESEEEQKESYVAVPTSSTEQAKGRVICKLKAKKKIMSKQPNSQFMKLMRQRKEQRNTQVQPVQKKKVDDVDLFCGHIAEVLRKLPPMEKAKAKQHLNNILSKYEIMAAGKSSARPGSSKDV